VYCTSKIELEEGLRFELPRADFPTLRITSCLPLQFEALNGLSRIQSVLRSPSPFDRGRSPIGLGTNHWRAALAKTKEASGLVAIYIPHAFSKKGVVLLGIPKSLLLRR